MKKYLLNFLSRGGSMLKSREIPPKNPRVFQRKVCIKSVLFAGGYASGLVKPLGMVYIYTLYRAAY